jgi:hypothetical protein
MAEMVGNTGKNILIPSPKPQLSGSKTISQNPPTPEPYKANEFIKFPDKAGGNVSITRLGENFQLTPEEYNAYQGRAGMESEQVKRLKFLGERDRLKQQIDQKLREGSTISQITEELLNNNANRQIPQQPINQKPEAEQQTQEQQTQEQQTPENMNFYKRANIALGASPEKASASLRETGSNILGGIVKTGAEIYDFVYSLTQGGKSIKQKEAETTFNRIETDMTQDIALVKAGFKDPYEVRKKIKLAKEAINRLEESTAGLGKANLRYWLTDGKDIQAQLLINRQDLIDFENQLLLAEAEARINSAKTTYQ